MSDYLDKFKCPKCGDYRLIVRRLSSAGKLVQSYCCRCRKTSKVIAGPVPPRVKP